MRVWCMSWLISMAKPNVSELLQYDVLAQLRPFIQVHRLNSAPRSIEALERLSRSRVSSMPRLLDHVLSQLRVSVVEPPAAQHSAV